MTRMPTEYKAAAETAERELPKLRLQKDELSKRANEIDGQIRLAEMMIELWQKLSGLEPIGHSVQTLDATPPLKGPGEGEGHLHEVIGEILNNGRSLRMRDIVNEVSGRKGRRVSLSAVYSAMLRRPDKFEKRSKKWRLKAQSEKT